MGLLSGRTKEQEIAEALEKHGLDVGLYDDTEIRRRNAEDLKQIGRDLSGMKWFKAGLALSFASADKQATVGYLSTLVRQNWIIIRQNELIIRHLTKPEG